MAGCSNRYSVWNVDGHESSLFNSSFTFINMTLLQVILCIVFPPLAVLHKGLGNILLVCILTAVGWIPGIIAAFVILNTK